ncbi:unnamed protein product, partial [Rotaria sordida]
GQQQQRPTVLRQELPQLAQKPPPLSGSKPQALQQIISQGRQQARKARQIASKQPPPESVIVLHREMSLVEPIGYSLFNQSSSNTIVKRYTKTYIFDRLNIMNKNGFISVNDVLTAWLT